MIENVYEFAPVSLAYIDPGTGSMLFTIIIGLVSVFYYAFKSFFLKIKYSVGVSKKDTNVNQFAIYTDSKRYWNTFKSVCEEFEKRKEEIFYYTQSSDDPVFKSGFQFVKPQFIGEGNSAFRKLNFLKANILLSTTPSLDVFQWKRSKDTKYYIHIPHMCHDISTYRLYGIDYYDAILVSNKFQLDQIREMESIRNLPKKDVRIVGLTYFDEMKKKLDNTPKPKNSKKVVLLAPSWGESSILNRYGSTMINELLNTNYHIIIRPHPQSYISESNMLNDLMSKYPDIEWNNDNDNFDVLNRADVLISDFSGVIFDFALVFDKPIIYADTSFDDSPYDAHWLDSKMWTFEVLPKIGREINKNNIKDLKAIIDSCLNSNEYAKERKEAISEAWFNKGEAAKLIVDYMIEKNKEFSSNNND